MLTNKIIFLSLNIFGLSISISRFSLFIKSWNSFSICANTEEKSDTYQSNGPEAFLKPNLDKEQATLQLPPKEIQL